MKAPRFARFPLRAFASRGRARGVEECAANRALPAPRFRVSRMRARGRRKAPRFARCPLRAFAFRGAARGTEESRRESRVARSALSRLADAREGLKKSAAIHALPAPRFRVSRTRARDRRKPPRIARCPLRAFASRGRARGAEESRRESRVAYSTLARLADAREGLKKAAANRELPTPRFRVSRMRARG